MLKNVPVMPTQRRHPTRYRPATLALGEPIPAGALTPLKADTVDKAAVALQRKAWGRLKRSPLVCMPRSGRRLLCPRKGARCPCGP
jgi:hypothetical protein